MSRTGGGRGTNQYGLNGVGKSNSSKSKIRSESDVELVAVDRDRDWSIHETQYGQTPIGEDDRVFLTPRYQLIVTMDQLNEAEAGNIARAIRWLGERQFDSPQSLLNQIALRDLHHRMFCDVWTWAGKLRRRETNMGVDPTMISHDWEVLLRNTITQIDHRSYPVDEIGVRLHRSMLAIHCFTNGNGRHARMVANELGRLLGLGDNVYTWGARSGLDREIARRRYLDALRLADNTDEYGPLVEIARS